MPRNAKREDKMDSKVERDGKKVIVTTGYQVTVFKSRDNKSAAEQIAILHEQIILLWNEVRELRQRSILDGL